MALAAPAFAAPPPGGCKLSAAEKLANAGLSFDDFDQKGTLPSTGRALMERGCFAQAVEAWNDYLIRGPVGTDSQRRTMMFHLGQSLASTGDEAGAARAMAASRSPAPTGSLDWNTYVQGSWAFLVKDREILAAAERKLAAQAGPGNAMNADMLGRLLRCFDRSYDAAYEACAPTVPGK